MEPPPPVMTMETIWAALFIVTKLEYSYHHDHTQIFTEKKEKNGARLENRWTCWSLILKYTYAA